ncbi:DUF2938 family protein [Vibrio nigripulchritudo]|uniref:DUF2938 family protein n=1 Tax=Vibrio nigripulchritudo TaxID=28173 RepID=UPI0005FA5675|nr:DUF2938 family protein [Vibrio nigripulchritudo]KJY67856.1 membrane protein [Vibrio nigripulchritudo]
MREIVLQALVIGVGATAFMDVFAWLQKRLLNLPSLDYSWVGRWMLCMRKGQFMHSSIMATPAQRGETVLGWVAHYAIGIAFVWIMLCVHPQWTESPSLVVALFTGFVSVAAPFLIMQPAFGLGVAAQNTPKPNMARIRSVVAHLSFGFGIYLTTVSIKLLIYPYSLWG